MKHKVKIIILSVLGVLLVGSSVAYAYSQKGTLISQKTEELPVYNTWGFHMQEKAGHCEWMTSYKTRQTGSYRERISVQKCD